MNLPGRSDRRAASRGPTAAGAALLVFVLLAAVSACAPEEEPPTAGPEVLRDGVDMVIIGMEHYLTRLGVRRAHLLADTAEYVNENEIHLRPVRLIFFDDQGGEISVLTADYGIFFEVAEDMEATGNVVVLDRRDDRRLETERIRYTKMDDKLHGDTNFVIESDGGRTINRGEGFESDPGLDEVYIIGPEGSSAPRLDTLAAAPDSLGAEGQPSLPEAEAAGEVLPDSTLPDSTVPDTTTNPDSSAVAPDSSTAPPDSTVQDTTARDTTPAPANSTVRDTTRRGATPPSPSRGRRAPRRR